LYVDLVWRNDPSNSQNLRWHQSVSNTTGNYLFSYTDKRSFVLRYTNDKETSSSFEQRRARILGTVHLFSPSCLTFAYQVTGDKSNKLSVSVNNRTIWHHRFSRGQRLKNLEIFLKKNRFIFI
jgi:hypothetical protein